MNKLFAMLPCYNEELNISKLLDSWIEQRDFLLKQDYDLKICPIDDCSTDNTKAIMLSKQEQYPNIVLPIFHTTNLNLGGGLNTSINFFLQNANKGDLMCLMDGDNTHDPKYVRKMLEKLNGETEVVIASRYRKGSRVFGVPFHRLLMSYMARIYYTIILNVPNVRDYTCGYRLYRYDAIKRLTEQFTAPVIKEKSFACMMELLYKLHIVNTRFDEVGFELRYDNKRGASKMKVLTTSEKSLVIALKLRRLKKKHMKL